MRLNVRILSVLLVPTILAGAAEAQSKSPADAKSVEQIRPFRSDADLASYIRNTIDRRQRWLLAKESRERAEYLAATASTQCNSPGRASGATVVSKWPAKGPLNASDQLVIKGRVTAVDDQSLAFANVMVPSVNTVSGSDANGSYRMTVDQGKLASAPQQTVRARRIGYMPKSAIIDFAGLDSVQLDFKLCLDEQRLIGVVITGMGGDFPDHPPRRTTDDPAVGSTSKVLGAYLIVLHRGRLFTIAIRNGDLKPVSSISAVGPGIDPAHTTQDQMFVYGDKVVVTGHNNQHGVEITQFNVNQSGALTHLTTYHMRELEVLQFEESYQARLAGSRIVLYTERQLPFDIASATSVLPALRRWHIGATKGEFRTIATADHVFHPARPLPDSAPVAMHAVTSCDLSSPELTCRATAIFGTPTSSTFSSPGAVYTWSSSASPSATAMGQYVMYRLPIDGSSPTAVGVDGVPVSTAGFVEQDGHLNVLLRRPIGNPGRTKAFTTSIAVLRLPLASFSVYARTVSRSRYRELPGAVVNPAVVGIANGSIMYVEPTSDKPVKWILRAATLERPTLNTMRFPYDVERVDVMGSDAVAASAEGETLHFSPIIPRQAPISLSGNRETTQRITDFAYRPSGQATGLAAYVVRGENNTPFDELSDGSVSIVFFRKTPGGLVIAGRIEAQIPKSVNDGCTSTCLDWYENARTLFVAGRPFALFGYEIVELEMRAGRMVEVKRVNFEDRDKTNR